MELVSPASTALSQVVKNMHPQESSASLSQQPHISQSLSNMHTNTTAAHNYTNQHSFSLNITSSTAGGTFSQAQEQAPASNHPVANPGGGLTFIQKSNNVSEAAHTSLPALELGILHAPPPSQTPVPVAAAAPVEPPVPEKSQSNGTLAEDGPRPSGYSAVSSKDKPGVSQVGAPVEEEEAPSLAESVPDDGATKLTVPDVQGNPEEDDEEEDGQLEPLAKPTKQPDLVEVQSKADIDCIKDIAATPDSDPLTTSTEVVQEEVVQQKAKSAPRKAKSPQDQEPKAGTSLGTAKRQRLRTQRYQCPLPEVELVSKISNSSAKSKEKQKVFYKNEFLAVRNVDDGFYLCQAVQNIYKTSMRIKIRWLSKTENDEKGEEYTPDFYGLIDFDSILTNVSLNRADKHKFMLPSSEKTRTQSILNRSLAVEKGEEIEAPSLTAEHPDGLDLSLYRDEDQLKKRKARKRPRKASPAAPPKQPPVPPKQTPAKKSPKVAKVKKPNPTPKRAAPVANPAVASSSRAATSAAKTAAGSISGKMGAKPLMKASSVVDQKKAKAIAPISRKAALASKSTQNTSPKNGKSGKKAVAASTKAAQPKASQSAKPAGRSLRSRK